MNNRTLLPAVIAALVLPLQALAATATVNGITWTYTVSKRKASVGGCSRSTGAITIPSTLGGYPVTSIGDWAFDCCRGLTSVTIPDSVTSIGEGAFRFCSGLTSMTIPNSVTSIGDEAFYSCSGLTSATISDSVTIIGNYAFDSCSALTSVTIPDSVTSIGDDAFYGCSSLTSVTIPDSVTSIGEWAFLLCGNLRSIVVDGANPVYDSRNYCNAIIRTADDTLVAGCKNTVILDSVTGIGNWAFNCGIGPSSVTIPASVIDIGESAFADCGGIRTIVVDGANPVYDSRNNCNAIIRTADDTLVAGCKNTVIPDSVTSIGDSAFEGCSDLTSVTIPGTVKDIGEWAFDGCSGLTSVTIGNGVTSIGNYAFQNCESLASVTIPDSVTSIGEQAFFWCTGLTSVTIPNSVKSIENNAFAWCEGLTSVTIGNGVTSIGDWAFDTCESLAFLSIPDSVTSIGEGVFFGCSSLTSLAIPAGVTAIGDDTFIECNSLGILYLPSRFMDEDSLDRLCVPLACTVINSDIHAFVKRLYSLCLGRDPDQGGINDWSLQLAGGANDGANVAFGFFMSQEMANRNLSNEDFVEVLYNVMMDRASDAGGKAYWVDALDNGVSRAGALRGFAESTEFTQICGNYGINRGSLNRAHLEPRDLNFGIAMFVARCYTKALGRAYDVNGLNYWCDVINSSPNPRAEAIYVSTTGFFDSQEFQLRGLSNSAFVDVLYQTFLGRAADAGGRADWVAQLNAGADRHAIMAGFYNSAEFNAIMAQYGIY